MVIQDASKAAKTVFARSSAGRTLGQSGSLSRLDELVVQGALKSLCADVIDASVVLLARQHSAVVVTSDVKDLIRLDPGLASVHI
jgi:hypothetical protein